MLSKRKAGRPFAIDGKNKIIQFRSTATEQQFLVECAERHGVTQTEVIREGIRLYDSLGWIPVSKPPQDDSVVIVLTDSDRYVFAIYIETLQRWFERDKWVNESKRGGFEEDNPAWWQPLPKKP